MKGQPAHRYVRPRLDRSAPDRGAANFYRAAGDTPDVLAGIPLNSAEAAVTAAVRMGYKIAEQQIDRTTRLARRFRDAGDRAAGAGSDKKALDATEQLVFKGMMGGLAWLEGFAAEPGNPLRRLASAEFRLIGALLGLLPPDEGAHRDGRTQDERSEAIPSTRAEPRYDATARARARTVPQVRHKGAERRAVQVREWELAGDAAGAYPLTFYTDRPGSGAIEGELTVNRTGSPTLTLTTTAGTAPGIWTAAICDRDGMQVGYIAIAV